jgi:hypothetical protein
MFAPTYDVPTQITTRSPPSPEMSNLCKSVFITSNIKTKYGVLWVTTENNANIQQDKIGLAYSKNM